MSTKCPFALARFRSSNGLDVSLKVEFQILLVHNYKSFTLLVDLMFILSTTISDVIVIKM